MKQTKKVSFLQRFAKRPPVVSSHWLQVVTMFIIIGSIASVGVNLTLSSHATVGQYGNVDFITSEGSVGNLISYVDISTSGYGSHSGTVCSPTSGTTGAHLPGHFTMTCQASSTGYTYTFNNATRGDFHISGSSPHQAGSTFQIYPNTTTPYNIVLDRDAAAAPAPAPAPAPTPTQTTTPGTYGNLYIHTFHDSINSANQLGSVATTIRHVEDNAPSCTANPGSTDGNGNHVMRCDLASDGSARTYYMASAARSGYSFAYYSIANHDLGGGRFHIGDPTTSLFAEGTTINIVMTKDPVAAPVSTAPTTSTSQPTTGSPAPAASPTATNPQQTAGGTAAPNAGATTSTTEHPATQKNGSVQVTTYIEGADGHRTRVNGVNIHIQSVGHVSTDASDSCDVYDRTSEGTGTAASNTNYGQVHFTNCFTGQYGTKAYQLSYANFPSGLSFKSYSISGGATFSSGRTSTDAGFNEQFSVHRNQETSIVVVASGEVSTISGINQVITQSGIRYVAVNGDPALQQAAMLMNITHRNGSSIVPLTVGITDPNATQASGEDTFAPSTPTNFNVTQDASGSVTASWDASKGNPDGENVSYSVSRSVINSTDEAIDVGDGGSELTALDDSNDLEYPKTYVYQVIATDDSGNDSAPATMLFTTSALAVNVPEATAAEPETPVRNVEDNATLAIPVGAASEALSCDVTDTDSTNSDSLASIGQASAEFRPLCRAQDGNTVEEFSFDVTVSFDISISDDTYGTDATLYGDDGTDWVEMPLDESDGSMSSDVADEAANAKQELGYSSAKRVLNKNHKYTYSISGKHLRRFVLVNKKSSLPIATSVISLLMLVSVGFGLRLYIRNRLTEKYEVGTYGDVDLISHHFTVAPTVERAPEPIVEAPPVPQTPIVVQSGDIGLPEADSTAMTQPESQQAVVVQPTNSKDIK